MGKGYVGFRVGETAVLVGYSHYLPDFVGHSHYLPIKRDSASLASLWCHSHYLPIHSHYLADPTKQLH